LLEENKQPPRYDKKSAADADWSIYSIPIEEGRAASLDPIRDFAARLSELPAGTKVLVFCESGRGRTAMMGVVYWIMKGLTASQAITRVQQAMSDWLTEERKQILARYEELQRKN
jgi:protein-tyrosine phosphatase